MFLLGPEIRGLESPSADRRSGPEDLIPRGGRPRALVLHRLQPDPGFHGAAAEDRDHQSRVDTQSGPGPGYQQRWGLRPVVTCGSVEAPTSAFRPI